MKRTPIKRTGTLKRTPMKRTTRRIRARVNPEDAKWSESIRARGGHWCERCRVIWAEHANHIIPRRFNATRFLAVNGISLCKFCHNEAHDDPAEFRAWFSKAYPSRWEVLVGIARTLKYRLRKDEA